MSGKIDLTNSSSFPPVRRRRAHFQLVRNLSGREKVPEEINHLTGFFRSVRIREGERVFLTIGDRPIFMEIPCPHLERAKTRWWHTYQRESHIYANAKNPLSFTFRTISSVLCMRNVHCHVPLPLSQPVRSAMLQVFRRLERVSINLNLQLVCTDRQSV